MNILGININRSGKLNPQNSFQYEKEVSKMYSIIETSPTRIEPSIDALIMAIQGAQGKIMQSRVSLYDLYTSTMTIDSFVIALIEKRLDNVANKSIVLTRDGKVLSQYNTFFQAPKFREFVKSIVLTQFWGMGLVEFHIDEYRGKPWFDYFDIPIKHINPFKEEVLTHQHDNKGVTYKGKDNLMFMGNKDSLGILAPITLLSIYKRLAYSDYARYSELASENFTITKYRTVDMDNIKRIEDAISNRGKGGAVSIPANMDIQQENQSSSQQNELFRDYNSMLKDDLAILILGQTMTTSDGSSRSQAEVHQEEQDSKFTKDEKYVLDILNYNFTDYLKLWNIKAGDNVQFKFEVNTDKEISKRISQYKALKELGIVFAETELRETFKDII